MSKRAVVIIGNGGHSRVLTEILLQQNTKILGFTAPVNERNIYNIPYLGDDRELLNYSPTDIKLVNAIGSVSNTSVRKDVYNFFRTKNFEFLTLIHPRAIVADSAVLGNGVQILAGVVIQPFAKVDDNTIVNTLSSVDHDCELGKHIHVAPGSVISGSVQVGDGTHIGTGSTIVQNVKVGNNVLIGAGSLVLNDISAHSKVFGTPAKEVSR
ncbi:acetyltransferase [Terribacillus sp. DMT04]|uniref:acetyltransferase n=1 Tax=Terribacillus sp. DMT04 TaxID=2850441 RepID=UPI001C2BE659|nr:acetyltransferase [Terribacillus sp. DMT04]QXE00953.1 acetyltransferase [Terribacillus sp. DMT04]